MEISLLIKHGLKQLVLTPEAEEEKAILTLFPTGGTFLAKRGSVFQKCAGGWIREYEDDHSLSIVISSEEDKQDDS